MYQHLFVLCEISLLLSFGTKTSCRRMVARLENAALNKPTVQGPKTYRFSTHLYESSYAVDGNPSTFFYECAGIDSSNVMWWIVDLKRSRKIHTVTILTKQDRVHFMENFTVDMFDEDPRALPGFPHIFGQVCATQVDPVEAAEWTVLPCSSVIKKRYVRVVKHGSPTNLMALCEVEVLAEPMSPSSGHAYKISVQSSATASSMTDVGTFRSPMFCAMALAEDTVHAGFQFDTDSGQCLVFETSPLVGDAGIESSSTWSTYTVL